MAEFKYRKPKIDPDSGRLITSDGTPYDFLPAEPAASPPHTFVHTFEPDPDSPDGHTHYLVGGDPEVVDQIVAWYAKHGGADGKGRKVPAEFKANAQAHADAVKAEAAKASGQDVKATPAAAAHAEATGVDLTQVEGTGAGGQITKADVQAAASEATPSSS